METKVLPPCARPRHRLCFEIWGGQSFHPIYFSIYKKKKKINVCSHYVQHIIGQGFTDDVQLHHATVAVNSFTHADVAFLIYTDVCWMSLPENLTMVIKKYAAKKII